MLSPLSIVVIKVKLTLKFLTCIYFILMLLKHLCTYFLILRFPSNSEQNSSDIQYIYGTILNWVPYILSKLDIPQLYRSEMMIDY